ncbi:MAG: MmgE/PrpD family protein [Betaproteobacteria bacterium]|nr:MmgE/PrpD family protein [Betaproteobacteria bacterium]
MSSSKPPLLEHATRDLARFASSIQFIDLPKEVIERIKLSVLDHIGCVLYGATLPWTQKVAELALAEDAKGVASLYGMGKQSSVALAALVNGTSGHAFELDDIHKESIVHIGSLAPPVALGFAEAAGGMSGKAAITAMVAGYEIGARVGNAATMGLFFRGFHPQGTSGVFASAAAAARILNLNADQFLHALGMAGSQAGGLMAAQEGAMVKRFHSGRAAQSGVYCAQLAQRNFTGITDVLEAAYGGYLTVYSDTPNAARLTDGLGQVWETANVGYKPHASVTSIHTALDGLAEIMREMKISANDIAKLETGLSPMTHVHCAWTYKAQGVTAAQMNLYYGLAVTAIDGMAFTEQYKQSRLNDPAIFDFISRVSAYVDPEIEKMGAPFRHAARVKVTAKDGRVVEKLLHHRRGSPEKPLSPEEIEYKFRNVVSGCVPKANIDKFVKLAATLDRAASTNELTALMAKKVQGA